MRDQEDRFGGELEMRAMRYLDRWSYCGLREKSGVKRNFQEYTSTKTCSNS